MLPAPQLCWGVNLYLSDLEADICSLLVCDRSCLVVSSDRNTAALTGKQHATWRGEPSGTRRPSLSRISTAVLLMSRHTWPELSVSLWLQKSSWNIDLSPRRWNIKSLLLSWRFSSLLTLIIHDFISSDRKCYQTSQSVMIWLKKEQRLWWTAAEPLHNIPWLSTA